VGVRGREGESGSERVNAMWREDKKRKEETRPMFI
jgi:hypothetical protein